MAQNKRISNKIFTRYLLGKLSDEELSNDAYKLSKTDIEHMLFIKQQLHKAHRKTPLRISKAWKEVKQRCNPLTKEVGIKKRHASYYLRYAATAAVFVLGACLTTFYLNKNNQKNRGFVSDKTTLIDKRSAYLQLADGRIVDLNEAGERVIEGSGARIQLSQQNIHYSSKGELADGLQLNTLKVPKGGEYRLTLSDGTIAWLNSESELIFPSSFEEGTRKVKLKGEAYFEVSKRTDSRFIIETGKGDVEVLGTSFNVSSYDDDKQWHVTLVNGTVDVMMKINGTEKPVRLKPSQQLMEENGKIEVRTVDTQLYTSWREGVFAFENMPLNEIAMRLERWYDVQITFSDSISACERYTGIFRKNEALDDVISTILNANKVRLHHNGKQINIQARSNMH